MDKIKTLSIDIETFSDVDLAKCGVYRYVESPAFEILLFGVSVNGGDVVVYDLAHGEKISNEILAALTDNSIIKWAFNAAFERVCLSMYLGLPSGEYLDPTSWRCSMVWSAYMGLPLSLAGAGAVPLLSPATGIYRFGVQRRAEDTAEKPHGFIGFQKWRCCK